MHAFATGYVVVRQTGDGTREFWAHKDLVETWTPRFHLAECFRELYNAEKVALEAQALVLSWREAFEVATFTSSPGPQASAVEA